MMSDIIANSPTVEAELRRVATLSHERRVWAHVGQLFDGLSDSMDRDAHLVFDALGLHFVGTGGRKPSPVLLAGGQTKPDIELAEWVALPCLIEAHAHIFLDGAPIDSNEREQYLRQPAKAMLARAEARWPRLVEFGVGAMRDAGDKYGVGLALAAKAKQTQGRTVTTPWIDSPGAAIHHRGRYGSFMAEPVEDFSGVDECVANRIARGADRIKLLATGIINFKAGRVTAPPQMSAEEVGQFVKSSAQRGRPTFAHATGTDGIQNCLDGGVHTIEHGFFVTEEQLSVMRDRQIAWVPTFAPVQLQIDRAAELGHPQNVVDGLKAIIDGHQQMLVRAAAMGVRIVAGSDAGSCGVPHGAGLIDEMCQMEAAGMSALAVLRAATGDSAAALNFPESIGLLRAGCRARIVFTRHDIAASVANLRLAKEVFFDGQVISGAASETPDARFSAGVVAGL
jgi:imidazolonepropionase-like amidohydrolase